MQNLAIVNVLHCETNLREVVQYFVFSELCTLGFALLNYVIEAALISVLHHDVPVFLPVLVRANKRDNIRVAQTFQNG